MKIAIIGGAGKMGQWFAARLSQDGAQVVITGRNPEKLQAAGKKLGVPVVSNTEAVKQADAVILSVPLDAFEAVVKGIAPYARAGQLFFDVTSLKTTPVEIMHRYLDKSTVFGNPSGFRTGGQECFQSEFYPHPHR